jgi:polynucleotide 5'-hydroxyl-kinase GRC3/NOL9
VTVRLEETNPEWEQLDLSGLSGPLLVVGPTDVGKTTFSRYFFKQLCKVFPRVAYLDGDPGQSTLGPPATMTLALGENGDDSFPPRGPMWRGFVGSVSPAGHMLLVLTCGARLIGAARGASVQATVYDTTGLVDPARGGIYLKLDQIDLFRPAVLFAIQRDQELKSLLLPPGQEILRVTFGFDACFFNA